MGAPYTAASRRSIPSPRERAFSSARRTALALVVACSQEGRAAPPLADVPVPERVKANWSERLDGRHFTADVLLRIERAGWREERRVRVFRDDEGATRERLLARFEAPPDLKGVGLLYLENAGRPNDYFLYQPSARRVRRIAETLAREDVYGVDLEYLGFGVAQIEPTEVAEAQADVIDDRSVIRLTERATRANPRFEERVVWLDPRTWVALRTEHRRRGATTLVARTEQVRELGGTPTPTRVVFERLDRAETVTLVVERIDYASPIPDAFFSALRLVTER